MSIVLTSIGSRSKQIVKFVDLLEVSSERIRYVRYFGVAEALINIYLIQNIDNLNRPINDHRIALLKHIDKIAELTIIDRELFKSIVDKVLGYNLYKLSGDINLTTKVASSNCLLDILGVTTYYSSEDIFAINKEFVEYKNAIAVSYHALRELLFNIKGDYV